MKINRLDAHDRFQEFTRKEFDIGECCQNLIDQRPYGEHSFYIFAHVRTDDDGVTKRMIWQPRLTKPRAQENSMLFKGTPGSDVIRVIWIIPARELWEQFERGKMTENETVCESIHLFKTDRRALEVREEDDLPDHVIDQIYKEISKGCQRKRDWKILEG